MRNANTQTMPKILVINDWMPPLQESTESLIHWDFPEDEEPYSEITCFNSMDWNAQDPDEIREWRDDYYAAIRL